MRYRPHYSLLNQLIEQTRRTEDFTIMRGLAIRPFHNETCRILAVNDDIVDSSIVPSTVVEFERLYALTAGLP